MERSGGLCPGELRTAWGHARLVATDALAYMVVDDKVAMPCRCNAQPRGDAGAPAPAARSTGAASRLPPPAAGSAALGRSRACGNGMRRRSRLAANKRHPMRD